MKMVEIGKWWDNGQIGAMSQCYAAHQKHAQTSKTFEQQLASRCYG